MRFINVIVKINVILESAATETAQKVNFYRKNLKNLTFFFFFLKKQKNIKNNSTHEIK